MKKKMILTICVSLALSAGPVVADPGGPPGAPLQGVLDGITDVGPSSVDVTNDYISDDLDSLWQITATGGSVATIVIELAGFAGDNTFGVYDPVSGNEVELFTGANDQGDQVALSIKPGDGSVYKNITTDTGVDFAGNLFGYYLLSPQGKFYSETSMNPDDLDHMYAYQGQNDVVSIPGASSGAPWTPSEYVLAFEDLLISPDWDYTDMVVMVESVQPVPVPGAVLLGILGLSAAGIKLRKYA